VCACVCACVCLCSCVCVRLCKSVCIVCGCARESARTHTCVRACSGVGGLFAGENSANGGCSRVRACVWRAAGGARGARGHDSADGGRAAAPECARRGSDGDREAHLPGQGCARGARAREVVGWVEGGTAHHARVLLSLLLVARAHRPCATHAHQASTHWCCAHSTHGFARCKNGRRSQHGRQRRLPPWSF
jgi:hypothetical protein